MDFLLGADPEFFVKENGKHISAYGLVNGTKNAPSPVSKGAVQVDGMALEFNINPAATFEEFNNNIVTVIDEMKKLVPDKEFDFSPVAWFDQDYMDSQPEDAKKLGCDPDFNAYTHKPNDPPNGEALFRTASGHIHVGWTDGMDISDPEHIEACEMMVRQLDAVLGIASIIWDPDTKRRDLYGKAGAYRPKSYGVEYRVMSNKWVMDAELRKFVFYGTKYAFERLLDGNDISKDYGRNNIRDVINNSQMKYAKDIASGISDNFGFYKTIQKHWEKNAPVVKPVVSATNTPFFITPVNHKKTKKVDNFDDAAWVAKPFFDEGF